MYLDCVDRFRVAFPAVGWQPLRGSEYIVASEQSTTASGGARVVFNPVEDDEEDTYVDSVGGYGGHSVQVVEHGWIVRPKHHSFIAIERVVAAADLDSLREAVADDRRCCSSSPESIYIALADDPDFHALSSDYDDIHLEVDTDRVVAVAGAHTRRLPPWSTAELTELLTPAVREYGCVVRDVTFESFGGDLASYEGMGLPPEEVERMRESIQAEPHDIRVEIEAVLPATAERLILAARDASALLDAYKGGPLNAGTVRNLLRAGKASLLSVQPESDWLEVKSAPYNIHLPGDPGVRSKIELAQDVARFANGDVDALLLIGFKETKRDGRSVVGKASPASTSILDVDRYRGVIDERVIPPIDGLTLEVVHTADDKGIMIIGVPAQAPELQPFLVHGAIVGDKVEGAFISVVRRRGEGSITTKAAQLHAYIVAGRAFLKDH
ncbi:hypothetical protein EV644_11229 [Kribbella orskensis]|uniref:Uncharacterized protein n=1 Tax=Kribbella orskensis TaxID=2512216 RepID=A0ABY2BEU7_9ACTN|nr:MULTISPECIES: hypothetical protein [Kribbella]TCN36865.1 hypothetical protein EV642_11329 [Kribbella sp. VKM Ac-2500]TCO18289.1 hypothetical protein EV644_11229 [Kribbella orskensis]